MSAPPAAPVGYVSVPELVRLPADAACGTPDGTCADAGCGIGTLAARDAATGTLDLAPLAALLGETTRRTERKGVPRGRTEDEPGGTAQHSKCGQHELSRTTLLPVSTEAWGE